MIGFNHVPGALRVPFVAVEFDNSRASQGPALLPYRVLLIGQKTSAGSAAANSLHRVTSADQLIGLAGRGSMLHRMAMAYFAANRSTETWVGVLEDDSSGVAATGTITVTGPALGGGTLSLYVGGELVRVGVATADDAAAVASGIASAINAAASLPVTATADAAVVTIAAKNKGACGNDIDLRANYQDGEVLPAGVSVECAPMSGGATNPDLAGLIAALGDEWFQIFALPYTDGTSLTAIETELASRFGPLRMIDGVAIAAAAGTHAELGTLGGARNSPHVTIVATNESPTPPVEYAAHVAGVAAFYGAADPARPFQTLALPWCKAPADSDRFTLEERNLLLFDGVSTTRVAAGGVVQIERLVTTYKTNAAGADDTSYLDVTTMLTLLYARHAFRTRMLQRYPRHKLASDGVRLAAGQPVITPKLGKAEAIAWFREMESMGLFENFDQFKQDLVVQRNAQDPNRLDFLLPPDLINQFIVGAAQIQFRL